MNGNREGSPLDGDTYRYITGDLHLHTALSPCAEREMRPDAIIKRAEELNLRMIAITDHNSAENVAAVYEAAQGTGITVLAGMEVQTREEVHVLCLFDSPDQALALQQTIYAHLPNLKNDERVFGPQWVMDAEGEVVGENERLLLVSTDLSLEEVVRQAQTLGGLCIPSHVDRPAYSVIANLGFIPSDLGLVAVEISHLTTPAAARARFPQLAGLGLVANSDAHRLSDMLCRNTFKVKEPTVKELSLALAFREGREMWIDGMRP